MLPLIVYYAIIMLLLMLKVYYTANMLLLLEYKSMTPNVLPKAIENIGNIWNKHGLTNNSDMII